MKRSALLPLLMFIPGCGMWLAPEEEQPYILHPWSESAFQALSLDPIRTINLPSGQPINVLKLGDSEVLEIKCREIPVEVATEGHVPTGTRITDPQTKQAVEAIIERATSEACALDALRVCRWITRNGRSTFSREINLIWWGGRHVGQAFYVRCMTPTEFGKWALSPTGSEARVSRHAEPMLREYLRRLGAQGAMKQSDIEEATP